MYETLARHFSQCELNFKLLADMKFITRTLTIAKKYAIGGLQLKSAVKRNFSSWIVAAIKPIQRARIIGMS